MLLEEDYLEGSVSKKRSFSRYTFRIVKRGLHHPCLAGHDPASHPVKRVGTQRVALGDDSMRLRVKARKDTDNEHVVRCTNPKEEGLCRKTRVLLVKRWVLFRK